MTVRTKRIVGPVTLTNASAILYTVPAGKTALIKDVLLADQGNLTAVARFFINGTTAAERFLTIPINPSGTVTFSPSFIVLTAGDVLRGILSAAGNVTLTMHGALLDGVA